jgi:hypothetical protein
MRRYALSMSETVIRAKTVVGIKSLSKRYFVRRQAVKDGRSCAHKRLRVQLAIRPEEIGR